jgi:N6-adenosine-specific RNA methylase IME4
LPSAAIPLARKGDHSTKPEAWLDYFEQVSPPPYVELFARRHRLGWDVWGNESANTAEWTA